LYKFSKFATVFLLILLASTIVLFVLNPTASAQNETATAVITATAGGTTDPAPGTYNYNNGSTLNIKAIPDNGYVFEYWVISGNYTLGLYSPQIFVPNPEGIVGTFPIIPPPSEISQSSVVIAQSTLSIICGFGYTFEYHAVFAPTSQVVSPANAIVIVLSSVGGTTNPKSGTYTYPEGEKIDIQATADSGYEFQYWIISGNGVPGNYDIIDTTNPTNVTCGYGYTYDYQPVFTPVASNVATGTPTEYFYAAIIAAVVLAIIAVIAIAAALMYRSRSKK
jgi:hypothetical protein